MLRDLAQVGSALLALAACGAEAVPRQPRRAADTAATSAVATAPVQDSGVAFRDRPRISRRHATRAGRAGGIDSGQEIRERVCLRIRVTVLLESSLAPPSWFSLGS
jgi:hypothetical protein